MSLGNTLENGKGYLILTKPNAADPGPLAFSAFALTTFVLSIHLIGSSKLTAPNIVLGAALFYGGLIQILAGMWYFYYGNTFGATVTASYGAFWISYGIIKIPAFGVEAAYETKENFENAIAVYLAAWTIFIASLRTTAAIVILLFFAFIQLLLLTIGNFIHSNGSTHNDVIVATGYVGIITALIAWYNSLAGLLTKETHFISLPVLDLSHYNFKH
ncbi:7683_t:CDS:2 [Diversispora eburnea]|uniref:7683_t:CDS:1 n=1 Tax=Diversispora eburnea TaxID=1213867 RepID=A0A9N8WDP9_9GLOM|nr:7683_t:CDS:2 [Diversispora eburnea]